MNFIRNFKFDLTVFSIRDTISVKSKLKTQTTASMNA